MHVVQPVDVNNRFRPEEATKSSQGVKTKCNPWMGCVPDRTPAGVPEEAEPEGNPMGDSIGFIPALLPERRGMANWFPGISLGSIPWLFSDAPSALKDPNRELLTTYK